MCNELARVIADAIENIGLSTDKKTTMLLALVIMAWLKKRKKTGKTVVKKTARKKTVKK